MGGRHIRRAGGTPCVAFVPGSMNGVSLMHALRRKRWTMRALGVVLMLCCTLATVASVRAAPLKTDATGDAVLKRTDLGADGPVNAGAHRQPDLIAYGVGAWSPDSPSVDLFTGDWDPGGEFLRLELVFDGRINPPGPIGGGYPFDPYLHGPHPVMGYVEIDMDHDVDTGGETSGPQHRYLGNAGRFGGLPSRVDFRERAARGAASFDGVLATPPFVDRSGEDFHLALNGWLIESIARSDESDSIFGPGETWDVSGRLFHRAHSYEAYSYACCHGPLGSYEPLVTLRFQHSTQTDRTSLVLVYPLTQSASAAARGEPEVELLDGDASNQSSVQEALDDLVFSVEFAPPEWSGDPGFPIIEKWGEKNPSDFLDPSDWRLTALLGMSYEQEHSEALFAWTDLAPDVLKGDLNGDGRVSGLDVAALNGFIHVNDGKPGIDADGVVNNRVQLVDFGPNFSPFDVNYDGVVDVLDRDAINTEKRRGGDFDRDGDVDQADFGHLQLCYGSRVADAPVDGCENADLDRDGFVDQQDLDKFQECATGPGIGGDPDCPD